MADDIQLKRSNVPGLVPAAGELLDGELAINTADHRMYAKGADGSVFVVNEAAAVVAVQAGSDNVTAENALGVVTISVSQPTALSAFENDRMYVTAAEAAAAAPVQNIRPGGALTVTSEAGEYTISAPSQVQADWESLDPVAPEFLRNKPTALSGFTNDRGYVDAAQAAAAAPVQGIEAGSNVFVAQDAGVYTIAVDVGPYVQTLGSSAPIVLTGSASSPVVGVLDATEAQPGVVQLAAAADIVAGTPGRVVDAAQLKAATPSSLSQITNDAGFITQAAIDQAVAGYLPLSGGSLSGGLAIAGSFSVSAGGTAQAPTPAAGDASRSIATTEWVQRELTGVVETEGVWNHGGSDVTANPTPGFLRVSEDGAYLAISKYATDGLVPTAASLPIGALVLLEVARLQLASEDGFGLVTSDGLGITTE